MLYKKFLCGLISSIMAVTVFSSSFYSSAVTSETTSEAETTAVSESENSLPLVTASSEYDAVNGVKDAEELKTSDNDITKQSIITVPDSIVSSSSLLNDKNRSTKIKFSGGDQITISNDKSSICALYIIWDTPVKEWTLSYNGKSMQCGQNGFIHEYAELETPANELTITLPEGSPTVCDIYTFSSTEKPSWVQDWKAPCEQADMLVLPARGNNEVIDFGGLIPYYAGEVGAKVQVAYMVNQWLEYYRPHEILNALWECGVEYYPVFGDFNDCEVNTYDEALMVYDEDEVTEYVVSLIRRFKPQVAVGQDLKGEGGKGMNMLYAKALADACEISADPNKYPDSADEYGVWDVPKTYLHLYGYSETSNQKYALETSVSSETGLYAETSAPPEDDELNTQSLGSDYENVTGNAGYNGDVEYLVKPIKFDWRLSLDSFGGKSAFEVAQAAFACHKSQTNWVSMADDAAEKSAVYGLYRTNAGYDKNDDADMFENLSVNIVKSDDNQKNPVTSEIPEKYKGTRRSSPLVFAIAVIMMSAAVIAVIWRKYKDRNDNEE